MMRIWLLLASASVLISCNSSDLKYDKPYFDFDSLIQRQIKSLPSQYDSLRKTAWMDGAQDVSTVPIDTVMLGHELDVFQQLDLINKPLFKEAYVASVSKDPQSNLMVRTYTLNQKLDVKSPVSAVRFYYLNTWAHIKKIESSFEEKNTLYFTSRKLTLELDDDFWIVNFNVSGVQKMILNDSVKFSISARIF